MIRVMIDCKDAEGWLVTETRTWHEETWQGCCPFDALSALIHTVNTMLDEGLMGAPLNGYAVVVDHNTGDRIEGEIEELAHLLY